MTIKYTSNGNNKWGLVQSESVEYETVPNRSGCALILFLVPAVAIIAFIVSHLN